MSHSDPNKVTSNKSDERFAGGFLGFLRVIALIVLFIGAAGSLGFMFRAGQRTPGLLLVAFLFWVLAPFAALLWANRISKRWSVPTQAVLYCVMLIVALGSLAIYGGWINVRPVGSANAFLFVAVPPVSLLFSMIVVSIATFIWRRQP